MSSPKRLTFASFVVAACLVVSALPGTGATGGHGGGGGGSGGGSAGGGEIAVWVVGSGSGGHGGGGGSGRTCWWTIVTTAIFPSNAPPIDVTRTINGVLYHLYLRQCSDNTLKMFWIPMVSPTQLATLGVDIVVRKLPPLKPSLSPPVATGGFVNFATWLAAVDPGPISADATIPGLRATVTATVASSDWAISDGTTLHCNRLGTTRTAASAAPGPCSHTFALSSAQQSGAAYTITVTVNWAVSWTSSSGQSGTLPDVSTSSSFAYRVREIQSIGQAG